MAKGDKKTTTQASQEAVDELFDDYFPVPNAVAPDEERDREVIWIDRDRIDPNPNQPRRYFAPEGLKALGESMREVQQLQPIVLRPHPTKPNRFQIVAGERRWRASAPEYGDIARLRATIRKFSDYEVARIVIEENERREDVSPIARARGLKRLYDVSPGTHGTPATWAQVAGEVGLTDRSARRLVELLQLSEATQMQLEKLALSEKHGRALLSLKGDARAQNRLLREIEAEELSGNEALRRAEALKKPEAKTSGPSTWTTQTPDSNPKSVSRETQTDTSAGNPSGAASSTLGGGTSQPISELQRGTGFDRVGGAAHQTIYDPLVEHLKPALNLMEESSRRSAETPTSPAYRRDVPEMLERIRAALDEIEGKLGE